MPRSRRAASSAALRQMALISQSFSDDDEDDLKDSDDTRDKDFGHANDIAESLEIPSDDEEYVRFLYSLIIPVAFARLIVLSFQADPDEIMPPPRKKYRVSQRKSSDGNGNCTWNIGILRCKLHLFENRINYHVSTPAVLILGFHAAGARFYNTL